MNKKTRPGVIANRRARYDYELGDSFMVGLVLSGAETKALRLGNGHLRGAYATVKNSELWLVNATIMGAPGLAMSESEQTQSRKILARRREIDTMIAAKQQGMTLVPTDLLTRGRYIKLRLSIGKGKKQYDKRQLIKKRDLQRSGEL